MFKQSLITERDILNITEQQRRSRIDPDHIFTLPCINGICFLAKEKTGANKKDNGEYTHSFHIKGILTIVLLIQEFQFNNVFQIWKWWVQKYWKNLVANLVNHYYPS